MKLLISIFLTMVVKGNNGSNLYLGLLCVFLVSAGCLNMREPLQESEGDLVTGRIQYQKHCAACHQRDGLGSEGGGPPLVNSSWVRGPESRLIRIVLNGVRGPIEVNGSTYNREMIGFGQVLTDDQIASLVTYVRNQWGEFDGPVSAENVGRIRRETGGRTTYWAVDELLRIP